ncbi:MAG: hypothetical protein FWG30_03695 [Eubacteriaceae bacterium]|nr:hypothetical protein [Eubacteriaceae bacterium]
MNASEAQASGGLSPESRSPHPTCLPAYWGGLNHPDLIEAELGKPFGPRVLQKAARYADCKESKRPRGRRMPEKANATCPKGSGNGNNRVDSVSSAARKGADFRLACNMACCAHRISIGRIDSALRRQQT